jgi:multidrug efflux pump subunit AcrA (membrane-fusion protein)
MHQVRLRDTLVELDQVRSENVRLSQELQASSEAVLESRRSVAAAKAEAAAAAAQSAARETAAANELRAAKEGATALQQQLREAMTAQDEAVKDRCVCVYVRVFIHLQAHLVWERWCCAECAISCTCERTSLHVVSKRDAYALLLCVLVLVLSYALCCAGRTQCVSEGNVAALNTVG